MPKVFNTWRRLCCTCNQSSDAIYDASYDQRPRHQGPRSRVKPGKKTWTRRSLLENEQIIEEHNHVTPEYMAYQMRGRETPSSTPRSEHDVPEGYRTRPDPDMHRQRQSVQQLFDMSNVNMTPTQAPDTKTQTPDTKTTFPWMDERFVPQSRSGTRLGISSVQLNVRRSELINALSNGNKERLSSGSDAISPNLQLPAPHVFESFPVRNENCETEHCNSRKNNTNSQYVQNHVDQKAPAANIAQQGSNILRSSGVPDKPKSQVPRSPPAVLLTGYTYKDNQSMFINATNNAPAQQIRPSTHTGTHNTVAEGFTPMNNPDIPIRKGLPNNMVAPQNNKVNAKTSNTIDETSTPRNNGHSMVNEMPTPRGSKVPSNFNRVIPSVMDVFPQSDEDLEDDDIDDTVDMSFASEVILRKAPNDLADISFGSVSHTGIFANDKKSKNKQLKSQSTHRNGKGKSKPEVKSRSESMYGYVPKAVQNVHASTALVGTGIDDFFQLHGRNVGMTSHRRRPISSRVPSFNEYDGYMILSSESESDEDFTINTTVDHDETHGAINGRGHCDSKPSNKASVQNVIYESNAMRNGHLVNENNYNVEEKDIDQMFQELMKVTSTYPNRPNIKTAMGVPETDDNERNGNQMPGGIPNSSIGKTCRTQADVNVFSETTTTDENKNKVIMIDFPPNHDNNIQQSFSNNSTQPSGEFNSQMPMFRSSQLYSEQNSYGFTNSNRKTELQSNKSVSMQVRSEFVSCNGQSMTANTQAYSSQVSSESISGVGVVSMNISVPPSNCSEVLY